MSFFNELKRRNVFRVGIAYTITAWLIAQVAELAADSFLAPNWVMKMIITVLMLGFPVSLVLAWAFELTTAGLRRETRIEAGQSTAQTTTGKLDRTIIIALVAALAYIAYGKLVIDPNRDAVLLESAMQQSAAVTPEPESIESPLEANKLSIAVLPFINMSSDPEQEYFSDGITEEILNHLAKNRELQVAARTSAFSFKGQDQDIRQIGEMLGVGTILEGSVRKDGAYIRITAQLIRASDGFHLWAETYDRKLENIFAIQDDIASQIAAALQISLGITTQQPGHSEKLVNPESYDLYLRARTLHRQRGRGHLLEALELFQQALDIDPQFAPAWAGLAHTYNDIQYSLSSEELERIGDINAESRVAAQKALELDPSLATALHAMANSQRRRLEWASAQAYYERALKQDPDSADVMEDYAYLLLNSIQFKASKRVIEHMLVLDPYVAKNYGVTINLYHTLGEFDKRDHYIQTGLDLDPEGRTFQYWNYIRLLQNGELQEAHNYVDQINQPGSTTAQSYHKMIDWMAVQDQPLDKAMQDAGFSSTHFAYVSGNYELYLTIMWHQPDPPHFTIFSRLLGLIVTAEEMKQNLAKPRTHELVQALRLPEYWREVGWPDMCRPVGEHDFECG
ncbi:MAG: hypothetical protein DRQ63_09420 [Gammaproteobacteria bacterium]|nr:MAG: hypothetical protein DRQ63_09420 [Gammaproteobacteria bacterium]